MKRIVITALVVAFACGRSEVTTVLAKPALDAAVTLHERVIAKIFALAGLAQITRADVQRVLDTKVIESTIGDYRSDFTLADTPEAMQVELSTATNGWAAITFTPSEPLRLAELESRLIDLPYAPGFYTVHHSDGMEPRAYHRFGVHAGELVFYPAGRRATAGTFREATATAIEHAADARSADDLIEKITIVTEPDERRSPPLEHSLRWWRDWWAHAK